MKKLPESELELMMIIWRSDHPMTRPEIEKELEEGRKIGPTTLLSFLSRLQEKGFVKVTRQGKNNLYEPLVTERDYLREESGNLFKKLYRHSVRNFMTALYDGDQLSETDLDELQEFLDEKRKKH